MAKMVKTITFRTTETIFDELEFQADARNWSIGKYLNLILSEKLEDNLNREEEHAKIIYKAIEDKNISTMSDLVAWAIEEGMMKDINTSIELWRCVIEEKRMSKGI